MQILKLSRVAKANTYTQTLLRDLEGAIEHAETDPTIRTLAITGEGDRTFCGGADLDELASRSWLDSLNLTVARVFSRLATCRIVTLAVINGDAVGGGLELALHCDLRIASRMARFWLPEPELGILPAAGGLRRLPAAIGHLRALDLVVGGARWSANKALEAGLLTELAEPDELWSLAETWSQRVSERDEAALIWSKILLTDVALSRRGGIDRLAQATLVRERGARR